jgi:hypothetical protein
LASRFYFVNLIPLIPLPSPKRLRAGRPLLTKERGRNKKEGAKPPLKTTSPFPLRGRGIKGDGVLDNLFIALMTTLAFRTYNTMVFGRQTEKSDE